MTTSTLPIKLYHLECVVGEHVYIGTDIKARSFEQAKSFMQFLFKDKISEDTEIFLIKETTLH